MSSPHVVFINGRFLTQRLTGIQRYAREVLLALDRALASADQEFEFTLLAPPGTVAPALERIRFETVGPLKGNAWEQITLPLVSRGRLLVSFCSTGPALKRNQIVTIHDASVHTVPDSFTRAFRVWYKVLLRVLAQRVPAVMTVSAFSKREVTRYFRCDPSKIHVSPEGWQHLLRTPADDRILAKHSLVSGKYVLAVSSLTPNKNFALIVEAMRRMGPSDITFAIAGGTNAKVFGSANLSHAELFRHLGYVSDAELRALYQNAAAFIFPSRYEGFGLPAIEAMASGCPIIVSDAGALPETCGEAALYVSPDDPDALVGAIRRLLTSQAEREELIRKGREWVSRYDWELAAEANLRCIRGCLPATPEVGAAELAPPLDVSP